MRKYVINVLRTYTINYRYFLPVTNWKLLNTKIYMFIALLLLGTYTIAYENLYDKTKITIFALDTAVLLNYVLI